MYARMTYLYLDHAALKSNPLERLSAGGSMQPKIVFAVLVAVLGTLFGDTHGSGDSVVQWNQNTQCCRPPWGQDAHRWNLGCFILQFILHILVCSPKTWTRFCSSGWQRVHVGFDLGGNRGEADKWHN